MDYFIEGRDYTLSYQKLKDAHFELCSLSDQDFIKRLPEALHLACIICWLKEAPCSVVLSDRGIIHELVHAIHIPEAGSPIGEIREKFKEWLELA